jgi:cAMP phosphodiesterase
MRFKVLGCFGGQAPGFHLSSFLIEDRYLIDAGAAASCLSLDEQAKIDHILLTHAHLDHILGIFFMADNVLGQRKVPLTIYSIPHVINSLKDHMLNNVIWPDFTRIPSPDAPTLAFKVISEGSSYSIGDLLFTPIAVSHSVPAVGYLVKDSKGTILYTGDTGPTDKIWKVVASVNDLKAIIVEVSFPNRLQKVADLSGHLTPQGLQTEIAKAGNPSPPIYITHIKPQFLEEITRELHPSPGGKMQILEQGKTYRL